MNIDPRKQHLRTLRCLYFSEAPIIIILIINNKKYCKIRTITNIKLKIYLTFPPGSVGAHTTFEVIARQRAVQRHFDELIKHKASFFNMVHLQ